MSTDDLWKTQTKQPLLGPPDPNCNRCKGNGSVHRELAPNVIHHIACDCEDPDARPDDVAVLAQSVAKSLRAMGIRAFVSSPMGYNISTRHVISARKCCLLTRTVDYRLRHPPFDKLGPSACVREIQQQEATRARDDYGYSDEWSADKLAEKGIAS